VPSAAARTDFGSRRFGNFTFGSSQIVKYPSEIDAWEKGLWEIT